MNDSLYVVYIKRVLNDPRQYFAYQSIQPFPNRWTIIVFFLCKEGSQYIR